MGDEAFKRGFDTADLLSNPYPDNTNEARRFVDGRVAGRKWDKSHSAPESDGEGR